MRRAFAQKPREREVHRARPSSPGTSTCRTRCPRSRPCVLPKRTVLVRRPARERRPDGGDEECPGSAQRHCSPNVLGMSGEAKPSPLDAVAGRAWPPCRAFKPGVLPFDPLKIGTGESDTDAGRRCTRLGDLASLVLSAFQAMSSVRCGHHAKCVSFALSRGRTVCCFPWESALPRPGRRGVSPRRTQGSGGGARGGARCGRAALYPRGIGGARGGAGPAGP